VVQGWEFAHYTRTVLHCSYSERERPASPESEEDTMTTITATATVPGTFCKVKVPAGALARIAADVDAGYECGAFMVGETSVSWTAQ